MLFNEPFLAKGIKKQIKKTINADTRISRTFHTGPPGHFSYNAVMNLRTIILSFLYEMANAELNFYFN